MDKVVVKLVRLWSSRGALSVPEETDAPGECVTFPEATGNDRWQVWKEYPREEDKGKWFLCCELAESEVAALPGRCLDMAARREQASREFVEASYRDGRSTFCPPWLQAKMVEEMDWPTNLDPVEAMDWPDSFDSPPAPSPEK